MESNLGSKFGEFVLILSTTLKKKQDLKYLSHLYTLKEMGYFTEEMDLVLDTEKFNLQLEEEAIRVYVFCVCKIFPEIKSVSFSVITKPHIELLPTLKHFEWLIKFFAYQELSNEALKGHYRASEDCISVLNSSRVPYKFDLNSMRFRAENVEVKFVSE